MIRISCTELDAYRYWQGSEDAPLEALLAQLRKETPPTPAMQAGTAWHKALERMEWEPYREEVLWNPDDGVAEVEQDGWRFLLANDIELCLPEVAELKGEMELTTPAGLVTLVGVVDGIDAQGVRDYKLSQRFDAERYIDSMQWRCYLHMFGAQRFTYHVFECSDPERSRTVAIRDYHQLPLFAYPRLAEDVQRAVADFAAFITDHLPERVSGQELTGVH